ncbi:hypothetical protein [Alicyclobacillus macrosporangiidus]|uniref:Uncharacterized protein n=1 Tax=Alicyclobacillus macrosporangiidus TaxID=392015 RepID=A0A1I7IC41_9BACL|nr:hypothetical protein [Alicyclobacillus macrosporangiidus]SFU70504.1 hypothetical protein SAMN05421543_106125 [Alicyclobacillus macrosporangiidus]
MTECWVKFPERGRDVRSLVVVLESLTAQLKRHLDDEYTAIRLDKQTRSIRVVLKEVDDSGGGGADAGDSVRAG